MTNETITRKFDDDSQTATITLPSDDRACLRIILELQRDASQYLLDAATRDLDPESPYSIDAESALTQFDYSGDHDDYNIAAAIIALKTTESLISHEFRTARESLLALFNDDDFLTDYSTMPLHDAISCDFLD